MDARRSSDSRPRAIRHILREFALCYERHPESMRTVPWLRPAGRDSVSGASAASGCVFQSVLPFFCFRPFNLRKNCLKILPFLCFTLSNIVQKPKTRRRESRKVSPDGSKNCAIISLSFAPMTKKCAHYFDVSKASFLALFPNSGSAEGF